jgi:hypothetical protein
MGIHRTWDGLRLTCAPTTEVVADFPESALPSESESLIGLTPAGACLADLL